MPFGLSQPNMVGYMKGKRERRTGQRNGLGQILAHDKKEGKCFFFSLFLLKNDFQIAKKRP